RRAAALQGNPSPQPPRNVGRGGAGGPQGPLRRDADRARAARRRRRRLPRQSTRRSAVEAGAPDRRRGLRAAPLILLRSGPMKTERIHYDDPLLLAFEANVVAHAEHRGRPSLILDRTAFYPESGGQMSDRGVLAGRPVLDVQLDGEGRVHHVLEGEL